MSLVRSQNCTYLYSVSIFVELKAAMEDQMGDFPTGPWASKNIKRISPGRSKPMLLSRGVCKLIKFDFPALSTDIIQH